MRALGASGAELQLAGAYGSVDPLADMRASVDWEEDALAFQI